MKTSILKIGFIFLLVCQSLFVLADYKDEILKLSRIDLLAQYQANVAVKQISSYSPMRETMMVSRANIPS